MPAHQHLEQTILVASLNKFKSKYQPQQEYSSVSQVSPCMTAGEVLVLWLSSVYNLTNTIYSLNLFTCRQLILVLKDNEEVILILRPLPVYYYPTKNQIWKNGESNITRKDSELPFRSDSCSNNKNFIRASARSQKKSQIRGVFRDKFVEKSANFAVISREFSGQTSPKSNQ